MLHRTVRAVGSHAGALGQIKHRLAHDRGYRLSSGCANQGKSRFLATASHDLRQPLQTLSLLNGALRRIVTERDATDALTQQEQAISAMSRLLNALLDISKLELGAIEPEPTDFTVAALFEEMRSDFAVLAANKGLILRIDPCPDGVHSDPSLVEQILRNLVSNAIKYTRQGWIQLRCLREAALVRIEVLDTGVGIPASQLHHIYDEFYQVGVASNTSRDGYGLGLSIVQRLVKLLDLRLDVRSEVGKGSAFSLVLPSSHRAVGFVRLATRELAVPQRQIGKINVLLVEDDPAVRDATRGTISDYDPNSLVGLIDADDGRLILFNLQGVEPPARDQFNVGTRVQFVERLGSLAPRACTLSRS